jgi:outer membrane protein insertion porin family/translocation and assembly module TamA
VLPIWGAPLYAQDIECDPGDREVRSLEFQGNHAFSDGELALRIVTTSSSWARRYLRVVGSRRCLDSDELVRDKYRLQLLYRNAGYYDTSIDTLVTPVNGRNDQVRVAFNIDEGKPIRIHSLSITGLDSVPNRREILRRLWVQAGKPYDQTRIALDADTILARLRNSGYPRPDVLRSYQMRRDSLTARVELVVIPGPRARVGNVVIDVTPMAGHPQEIAERVVRKLVGIGPGAVYREQALSEAQGNLYQTGAYRYVDVSPVPDSAKLYADSAVSLKVTLIEDYMRDLSTEVGWATLDCFRTRMQVIDKNFFGGAQRLELTGQLSKLGFGRTVHSAWVEDALCSQLKHDPFSTELNYSINVTLRQPTLFGTWATPAFSLYSERRGEYKAYLRTTYFGGEASLLKALRNNTSLRASYNFEYGRTKADESLLCAAFGRCDPLSLEQIQLARRLAILSVAAARASTDNPINPTSGYVLRGESRNSATFFGSDPQVTFAKAVGDVAWYHPLGWGSVFAARFRAGSIWGGANSNGSKQPPQQERLYAGGASSVRGFPQNELGALLYVIDTVNTVPLPGQTDAVYFTFAKDTTRPRRVVPVGGNTLLVANFDYRLRSPFLSDLLQYTIFADVGSVWTRRTQSDFGGIKPFFWTPGVGFRVFTPFGPIQVNAGYNPYPPEKGQALYTPSREAAEKAGFTGVYCAVPSGTPAANAPIARLKNGVWVQDPAVECPRLFEPLPRKGLFRRLTFTFSIGPDF